jgi:hypothetical protein
MLGFTYKNSVKSAILTRKKYVKRSEKKNHKSGLRLSCWEFFSEVFGWDIHCKDLWLLEIIGKNYKPSLLYSWVKIIESWEKWKIYKLGILGANLL